jgi:hypothetical protein
MADDVQLDVGTGGVYTHTKERTSTKHNQVVEVNVGGASEVLLGGAATGLYVQQLPHLGLIADRYTLTSKSGYYTTTQTTTALWTPAGGKKLCILNYFIQAGGTTAGAVQLYFAASTTAFSRGTTLAIFDGEFAPNAGSKPGISQDGIWISQTADHRLHITGSAAINPLYVTVWGYEF